MTKCGHGAHLYNYTWWEYDARGIELCKVCAACVDEKLIHYRDEVLSSPNYECDEPIEEE
jgi:hypothetical protein